MKAIQCFSSQPVLQGRHPGGSVADSTDFELPDYLLLMMALSALQWRRVNGPIKLCTDSLMYHYLQKKRMTDLWDEIDVCLDQFTADLHPELNNRIFWSAAKFYCYQQETAPFVCIDTDLIVWERFVFEDDYAYRFAHWERIEDEDPYYPPIHQIQAPENYIFPKTSIQCRQAANASITVIQNEKFKEILVAEALRFMQNNPAGNEGALYATPEILYAEQRLPVILAEQYGYSIKPLIERVWVPKRQCFELNGIPEQQWSVSLPDITKPFTHLGGYKSVFMDSPEEKELYIQKLSRILLDIAPQTFWNVSVLSFWRKAFYVSRSLFH